MGLFVVQFWTKLQRPLRNERNSNGQWTIVYILNFLPLSRTALFAYYVEAYSGIPRERATQLYERGDARAACGSSVGCGNKALGVGGRERPPARAAGLALSVPAYERTSVRAYERTRRHVEKTKTQLLLRIPTLKLRIRLG